MQEEVSSIPPIGKHKIFLYINMNAIVNTAYEKIGKKAKKQRSEINERKRRENTKRTEIQEKLEQKKIELEEVDRKNKRSRDTDQPGIETGTKQSLLKITGIATKLKLNKEEIRPVMTYEPEMMCFTSTEEE